MEAGADGKPVVLEEHSYAQLRLPTQWLTYETHQHYLEWTDFTPTAMAWKVLQVPVTDLNAYSAVPPHRNSTISIRL